MWTTGCRLPCVCQLPFPHLLICVPLNGKLLLRQAANCTHHTLRHALQHPLTAAVVTLPLSAAFAPGLTFS